MRNNKWAFWAMAILTITLLTTCRKEIPSGTHNTNSMDDLVISPDFNWESSMPVHIKVSVNMIVQNIGKLCKISVYDGNPSQGGNLMTTGAAGFDYPFEAEWKLPTALNLIYIQAENDNGQKSTRNAPITA